MDLVSYITKLQTNLFAVRNDDDLADRLNYRYTVAILVAFAVIVSHRQFSETVIKCWVPAFFTPNYEAYANQVCWVSNTYYVNSTQNMPKTDDSRKSSEIKYYQWIPFILLIQALFLYIPRILWRLLSARAGLDMRDLIEAAHSYKSVEKYANKKKIMEYIVQNIDQYASNPRRSKSRDSIFQKMKFFGDSLFCGSGIYLGNYLVTTYFFIKIVYLFNSIVQFFVMNEFLGKQFHELGIDILRYMTNTYSQESSAESVYFPKVVMCDFRIREFGHPNFSHRYTIQCVLPINLYNQQIFTFLWFWFLILFCANFWAMCQWVSRMLPKHRRRYINRRLNMLKYFKELNESTAVVVKQRGLFANRRKSISLESKRQKKKFIDEYLKLDGVFILRMISMLTSEIVGTELLHELWTKRAGSKEKIEHASTLSVYGEVSSHHSYHHQQKKHSRTGSRQSGTNRMQSHEPNSEKQIGSDRGNARFKENFENSSNNENTNSNEFGGPLDYTTTESIAALEKEREATNSGSSVSGSGSVASADMKSLRSSRALRGRISSLRAFNESARRSSLLLTSDITSFVKTQQPHLMLLNDANPNEVGTPSSRNNSTNSNDDANKSDQQQQLQADNNEFEALDLYPAHQFSGQPAPMPIHKRTKIARLKQQFSVDLQSSLRLKTKRLISSVYAPYSSNSVNSGNTAGSNNAESSVNLEEPVSIVKKSSTDSLRVESVNRLAASRKASSEQRPTKKVAFASSVRTQEEDEYNVNSSNNNNNNSVQQGIERAQITKSSISSNILNEFDDVFSDLKLDMIHQ